MYDMNVLYMMDHPGDVDDEVYQTAESATKALANRIKFASSQPRGLHMYTPPVCRPLRLDVRAEQWEIMRNAQLGCTWTDEHQLSGPAELPDDFDNTDEADSELSVDSEHDDPPTTSRTLELGHQGTGIRIRRTGQHAPPYCGSAVSHSEPGSATAISSGSAGTTHAPLPVPEVVHRRAESTKLVTLPIYTTTNHEQHVNQEISQANRLQIVLGPQSDSSRNSWRSSSNHQTRDCKRLQHRRQLSGPLEPFDTADNDSPADFEDDDASTISRTWCWVTKA
jgi:hypothetical protein